MTTIKDILWAPNGIVISDIRLIKLLQSSPINRLKHIGQNGAANYFRDLLGKQPKTTRYEHSVGCMILTLIIGGTNEQAIVALLHDVMHTAFSHTVDFLADDASESFHEIHKKDILKKYETEFISILGQDWKSYFDEVNYPLVKKNNPFAIDIADYTARDGVVYGLCTIDEINKQIRNLSIDNVSNQLCCKTQESIDWWIDLSKRVNDNIYNSPWNTAINYIFAQEIKRLIVDEKITFDLLLGSDEKTEERVFELVKINVDLNINNKRWLLLKVNSYDPQQYTKIITTKMRRRYILPPLLGNHNSKLVSSQTLKYNMDLVYFTDF